MIEVSDKRQTWSLACFRIAAVAGVFIAILAALLIFNSLRLYRGDDGKLRIVDAEQLLPLNAALREDPQNEDLKQQIRQLDQQLRGDFFRREALAGRGSWLLIVGSAVFILALQLGLHLKRPRLPQPILGPKPPDPAKSAARAGRAVAAATLALAGLAVTLVWGTAKRFDSLATTTPEPQSDSPDSPAPRPMPQAERWFPSPEEISANWPRFRGPDGLGIVEIPDLPDTWNGETGDNILWKTEIPLPGENSPLVWGDNIFLSGATETDRAIYCVDTATGSIRWTTPVDTPQGSRAEAPEILEETGFAASTGVTDGRRVFAMFANGDIAGVAADGSPLWARHLGSPKNIYGHATSLTMWQDRVIVVYDQGDEAEDNLSRILALDAATGETVWSTPRPVPNSWVTPIIIEPGGKPQIITAADPWVMAYKPEDGSEIWRAEILSGDVAPSPAYANDMIYVANDGAYLAAIKVDGSGDVTESHIAWKWDEDSLPDMCSLLSDGPRFYMVVFGRLQAFDALAGKHLWEHDLEAEFQTSPTMVNGKLWFLTTEGETIIGTADNTGFTETGRNPLGEECGASPALAPGRIYLRSREHLFCIGNKDAE